MTISEGSIKNHSKLLPIFTLIVIAPLVAELLAGSTPIGHPAITAYFLVVYLPLYGCGALLIREFAVRAKGGWLSILLMGMAYGLIEEGFASQSLFNPTLYKAADFGLRLYGVNGVYSEYVISVHAIWSALIPITLVGLLFPLRRSTPYLGRIGLAVAAIFYGIGVALLWVFARIFFAKGYMAPMILPTLAVVVAVMLVAVALRVVPNLASGRPNVDAPAPTPRHVLVTIVISTLVWQVLLFLWGISPVFSKWQLALPIVLATLSVAILTVRTVSRWSRSRGWNDRHRLAVVIGAIGTHIVAGVAGVAQYAVDRIALAGLGVVVLILLYRFAIHVHQRVEASGE